jgi:hypothetical protein
VATINSKLYACMSVMQVLARMFMSLRTRTPSQEWQKDFAM